MSRPANRCAVSALAGGGVFILCLLGLGFAFGMPAPFPVVVGAGVALLPVMALIGYVAGRAVETDFSLATAQIERVAESDAHTELSIRSIDELGELTFAVEQARIRLAKSLARHREVRNQAEEADHYKTQFLTSVSHELRTPLNAILGFAEVLLREIDGPLNDSQREDVQAILSSGQHLRSLFDDVLDMSAMASGHIELHREAVELRPIVEEVVRLLEGQRFGRPVSMRVEIAEDLPPIQLDPKRLRQILVNLGTNALKFTSKGEVVFVAHLATDSGPHGLDATNTVPPTAFDELGDAANEPRTFLLLAVRDTGVGIPREALSGIFDAYVQAGDNKVQRRGTGLGLAICKRLVDLHGGVITVESEAGKGSAFTLRLPFAAGTAPDSDEGTS